MEVSQVTARVESVDSIIKPTLICGICGMDTRRKTFSISANGRKYYFCCKNCKTVFLDKRIKKTYIDRLCGMCKDYVKNYMITYK